MALEALGIALNNITTANSFSTGVLGMALQNQRNEGEGLAQMIASASPTQSLEHSVNPSIGGNIDLYI